MSGKREAPDEPEPPLSARKAFRRQAATLSAAELVDFLASNPSDKRLYALLKEYRGREDEIAAALQALARTMDVRRYLDLCERLPSEEARSRCTQILYDKLYQFLGQKTLKLKDPRAMGYDPDTRQLLAIEQLLQQPHSLKEWMNIFRDAYQLNDEQLQRIAVSGIEREFAGIPPGQAPLAVQNIAERLGRSATLSLYTLARTDALRSELAPWTVEGKRYEEIDPREDDPEQFTRVALAVDDPKVETDPAYRQRLIDNIANMLRAELQNLDMEGRAERIEDLGILRDFANYPSVLRDIALAAGTEREFAQLMTEFAILDPINIGMFMQWVEWFPNMIRQSIPDVQSLEDERVDLYGNLLRANAQYDVEALLADLFSLRRIADDDVVQLYNDELDQGGDVTRLRAIYQAGFQPQQADRALEQRLGIQ